VSDLSQETGLHFHIGRIPVLVRPVFFIVPLIGAFQLGAAQVAIWAAVVFVSVLLHELGHAWAMRAFGFEPAIELHGMGGATHWPPNASPTAKMHLLVSLSGPGIQLVLGVLVLVASRAMTLSPTLAFVAQQLVWVNIVWALVNLLPILPWDGGQSLDAFIRLVSKSPLRNKIVGGVSMVGSVAVIAAAVKFSAILLGYLGFMGIMNGWRRWQAAPARSFAQSVAESDDAALRAFFDQQMVAGDLVVLDTLTTTLFGLKRYALAEVLLRELAEQKHDARAAFNLACTLCKLNRLDEAQAAVERALEYALPNPEMIFTDDDLAPLRGRADFQALGTRLKEVGVAHDAGASAKDPAV
jgi:Zn-dependent protease